MIGRTSVALFLLFIVATGTAALEATVSEVTGNVEVRTSSEGSWEPVEEGDMVPVGATISTSFNSRAVLAIGESSLTVRPLTRIRIAELAEEQDIDRSEIELPVGRMRANVRSAERRAEFRVTSPLATAAVRGTEFDFDGVNLSVSEGTVVLANSFNETVAVAGGEQSSAGTDAPPREPAQSAEEQNTVTVVVGPGEDQPTVRRSTTGGITINWEIVD